MKSNPDKRSATTMKSFTSFDGMAFSAEKRRRSWSISLLTTAI